MARGLFIKSLTEQSEHFGNHSRIQSIENLNDMHNNAIIFPWKLFINIPRYISYALYGIHRDEQKAPIQ